MKPHPCVRCRHGLFTKGIGIYQVNAKGGGSKIKRNAEEEEHFCMREWVVDAVRRHRYLAPRRAKRDRYLAPRRAKRDRYLAPGRAKRDRYLAPGRAKRDSPLCAAPVVGCGAGSSAPSRLPAPPRLVLRVCVDCERDVVVFDGAACFVAWVT